MSILLLAFGLRVVALADAPPGLYYDEAAHGLDALRVWQGQHHLFFPTANGHEPLFTYVVAGFVGVLDNTILAIRLPAAFFGTLAVAACFALGRRLIGPGLALWAAALVAVTFWTLALSRIGYRANTLPVLFPLWLLSFWCCRGQSVLRPYIIAGALLGLTQYTYTAARFIPLLALILAYDWRRQLDRRGLWVGALSAALVTAPLALALVADLDVGTERIRETWLFGRPEPWALLWAQVRDHLLMFGWRGDPLWIHNIPLRPAVLLPVALLFWLAAVIGWRGANTRTLLWAVIVLLWPGILAVSNNPAAPDHLRVIEIATPVFLLSAVGLQWLTRAQLAFALPLALALWLFDGGRALWDYRQWATARESYEQFDADMTRLARLITATPDVHFIIPLSSDWHEFEPGKHWTIDYLTGGAANYSVLTVPYLLPELTAGEVALVKWQAGMHLTADPQRTLEGSLALFGYTKDKARTGRTFLLTYFQRSGEPITTFHLAPDQRYEGGLAISHVNLYRKEAPVGLADTLMAEVLWASPGPYPRPLSLSLRLLDAAGGTAGQVDSWLWNDLGETAERWRTPEQSRLFLEFADGALSPGPYAVALVLYYHDDLTPLATVDGADLVVGSITMR